MYKVPSPWGASATLNTIHNGGMVHASMVYNPWKELSHFLGSLTNSLHSSVDDLFLCTKEPRTRRYEKKTQKIKKIKIK